MNEPFWTGHPTAGEFARRQDERLARARQAIGRLTGSRGRRTIENTLRPYDEALLELDQTTSQASLIENVHPDAALREAAEKITQQASALATELSLNREVYDALLGVDLAGADPEIRHYAGKTLREFRLSGVDRDESTRARIQALNEELVLIGQEFSRNIREDRREVPVESPAELEGLPADFIERHEPNREGRITLTTDQTDALPVFSYAASEALRHRMYMQFTNRAFPKNLATLDRMIAKRHQLATLLAFPHWADYVTANKMVGSASNASDFIDRIVEASAGRMASDYRYLLARKRRDVPAAAVVNAWESHYYLDQTRKSEFGYDAQAMRPYFPYARVKQGALDVTGRLFSVTYRRIPDAPVWHPSVECYEVLEDGARVGRFYLDMHPRRDKYTHGAQFDIRTGVAGRQIPEAALVCNFPGGTPGDPGLMEYSDVRTLFHEFGHLLHTLFGGRRGWVGTGGIRTEHDFIEVPSQLLEEWTRDPVTLGTFARHYRTGEPIPAESVMRMNRATEFGKGLQVRRQMLFARTSLSCYDRPPAEVDTDLIAESLTEKYQPFPFVEGTHFQCAFGHLDGYSAMYYAYMWSLVIAKDMFSRFDRSNLLDPRVPTRFRDTVLAAGGSAPATELVQRFLGRPFSFDAYRRWLEERE